jgi:hypothetical protein
MWKKILLYAGIALGGVGAGTGVTLAITRKNKKNLVREAAEIAGMSEDDFEKMRKQMRAEKANRKKNAERKMEEKTAEEKTTE